MSDLKEIKSTYEDAYNQSISAFGLFHAEARTDLDMRMNEQWPAELKKWLLDARRSAYVFNKIHRIVSIITGYERRNRLALKIGGVGAEDDKACSQMTGVIMHLMTSANGYNILSDAFEWGSLVTGANLIHPYLDRDANIKFKRLPYNRFLLDPNMTEQDLSDCGYVLQAAPVTEDVAEMLCPQAKGEIAKIPANDVISSRWGNIAQIQGLKKQKMRLYEEFWERKTRKQKVLLDRTTGEEKVWEGNDKKLGMLQQQFPMISAYDKWVDTVELSVLLDGEPIWSGPDPHKIDAFPFVAEFGIWCPEHDNWALKLQPVIRFIRDVQRADNKRISQAIDIIETQITTGHKYKEGSVVNEEVLYAGGQGKAIMMKKDAQLADHEQLRGGDIPPGLFQLHQMLDENITTIPGINEELFGTETKDIAGVLSKMRQGAALTTLQKLFDNHRSTIANLGRLLVKMVQKNYNPQKIKRIINEAPVPQFYDEDLTKYDCIPMQGIYTDSQREMYYAELQQLKTQGYPIPAEEVLKASPVQMKDSLVQAVKQGEQQQAQQAQVMAAEKQILNQLRQGKIAMEMATAKERSTQADENVTTSKLNQAKTLVEMEKLRHEQAMQEIDRMLKIDVAAGELQLPKEQI